MTRITDERRLNPRIEINGDITYHTINSSEVRPGELENLSVGGARIWIENELPPASQLLFRVESDDIEELPKEFIATLLHILPDRKESKFGYGCLIEETEKPTN